MVQRGMRRSDEEESTRGGCRGERDVSLSSSRRELELPGGLYSEKERRDEPILVQSETVLVSFRSVNEMNKVLSL